MRFQTNVLQAVTKELSREGEDCATENCTYKLFKLYEIACSEYMVIYLYMMYEYICVIY